MKTPILTTGLTGLVGSRIQELLTDKYEFFNMDLSTGIDITQIEPIKQFVASHPAKIMIHLAGFTNVNAAFEQTDDKDGLCYRVNVTGTANIAQVCLENGIYLIHFSTDFVFAGDQETPYNETQPTNPIEWYGQTKAWAEEKVEEILDKYAIVRIGYPFRAKFSDKPDMLAKIKQGLSDGQLHPQFSDMIITPTFIDDLAPAMEALIVHQPTGIYHLNGSSSLSPYEIAQEVAATFGYDPSLVKSGSLSEYLKTTDRPYQLTLRIDNTKAQSELGIKLSTFKEALEKIKSQLK